MLKKFESVEIQDEVEMKEGGAGSNEIFGEDQIYAATGNLELTLKTGFVGYTLTE